MMLRVWLVVAALAGGVPAIAQITPEQNAKIESGLRDVVDIDEELKAITVNQDTLTKSVAARRDEYQSLVARYPEIVLRPEATVREMYRALYVVRMKRAALIRPLVNQQLKEANARSCIALKDLQDARQKLEESDG